MKSLLLGLGLLLGIGTAARAQDYTEPYPPPNILSQSLPTTAVAGQTLNFSITAAVRLSTEQIYNNPAQLGISWISVQIQPPGSSSWTNVIRPDGNPQPGPWVSPTTASGTYTIGGAGTYHVRYRVGDGRPFWNDPGRSDGPNDFWTYDINVASTTPGINSVLSWPRQQGQPTDYQITATNSPSSYTAAPLVPGLSLNAGTGRITGSFNPCTGFQGSDQTFTTTLTASNGSGTSSPVTLYWPMTAARIVDNPDCAQSVKDGSPITLYGSGTSNFGPIAYMDFSVFTPGHPSGIFLGRFYNTNMSYSFNPSVSYTPTDGPGSSSQYVMRVRCYDIYDNFIDTTGDQYKGFTVLGTFPQVTSVTTTPALDGGQWKQTVGLPASITANVTGSPPISYQWLRAGVAIPGATAATYTIPAVAVTDNVDFTVNVASPYGTALLGQQLFPQVSLPLILPQPAPVTVNEGDPASFTVGVSSTTPYTVQWYKNSQANPVPGATGISLTVANPILSDAADYFAVVTNASGFSKSSSAHLTVNPAAPRIALPATVYLNLYYTNTVQIAATVAGATSYRWFRYAHLGGITPLTDGGAFSGSQTAVLTITGGNGTYDQDTYQCIVGNENYSGVSAATQLRVIDQPISLTITQQPPAIAITHVGKSTSFPIAATTTGGALSYRWQRLPAGTSTWLDLADGGSYGGTRTATLTITGITLDMNGDEFQCVVSNETSATSDIATLAVSTTPNVPATPQVRGANGFRRPHVLHP